MEFTPKSIDDLNNDFLTDLKEKYSIENNILDEVEKILKMEEAEQIASSADKSKADKQAYSQDELDEEFEFFVNAINKADFTEPQDRKKNKRSPFDEVRPIVVLDDDKNSIVTTAQELEIKKNTYTEIPKANIAKSEQTTQKKKEVPKPSQSAPLKKNLNIKNEKVESGQKPLKEKDKAVFQKENVSPSKSDSGVSKSAPKKAESKASTLNTSEKVLQVNKPEDKNEDSTYNDYLEEFLNLLSEPPKASAKTQKTLPKKVQTQNTAGKNQTSLNAKPPKPVNDADSRDTAVKQEIKKTQSEKSFSKKLEEKLNKNLKVETEKHSENVTQANDDVKDDTVFDYNECFLKNSHAAFAKEQRLKRFFIVGCACFVTAVLIFAMLFTMSRFIPAEEIVEQSQRSEEVVSVNAEGNPHYTNETRLDYSCVETYSFSAFINTYYLHWAIAAAIILMGASFFFFSIYVRERGAGAIMNFVLSKIKNKIKN